jgi:hypothetical protein
MFRCRETPSITGVGPTEITNITNLTNSQKKKKKKIVEEVKLAHQNWHPENRT